MIVGVSLDETRKDCHGISLSTTKLTELNYYMESFVLEISGKLVNYFDKFLHLFDTK